MPPGHRVGPRPHLLRADGVASPLQHLLAQLRVEAPYPWASRALRVHRWPHVRPVAALVAGGERSASRTDASVTRVGRGVQQQRHLGFGRPAGEMTRAGVSGDLPGGLAAARSLGDTPVDDEVGKVDPGDALTGVQHDLLERGENRRRLSTRPGGDSPTDGCPRNAWIRPWKWTHKGSMTDHSTPPRRHPYRRDVWGEPICRSPGCGARIPTPCGMSSTCRSTCAISWCPAKVRSTGYGHRRAAVALALRDEVVPVVLGRPSGRATTPSASTCTRTASSPANWCWGSPRSSPATPASSCCMTATPVRAPRARRARQRRRARATPGVRPGTRVGWRRQRHARAH